MEDSLRHAKHVGNPHPDCEICVLKANERLEREQGGVPVQGADHVSVRAIGGFVQSTQRFVR